MREHSQALMTVRLRRLELKLLLSGPSSRYATSRFTYPGRPWLRPTEFINLLQIYEESRDWWVELPDIFSSKAFRVIKHSLKFEV